MAKIAFLLLCHKRADRVLEQARVLTSAGDYVVIHGDANAGPDFAEALRSGIADIPNVRLSPAERCGWGEWSLVKATLNMIRTAMQFDDVTHCFLMSGDCMPIKPAHAIRASLDESGKDWIEHADFFGDDWIKTGLKEDRLIYRHWFNERGRKWWFYTSLNVQRRLGLKRSIPSGLTMHIGSQWWVLRRSTIEAILAFVKRRKDVVRFFRTTWIPDETFFQTLVMHLVPKKEVISSPPTYLMFSDYGMPVTFSADHFGLLKAQDSFFARKISDHDDRLRQKLGDLFASEEPVGTLSDSGRAQYDYVRRRGRIGRRFGSRAWDVGARLGPDRALNVVVCKKWHVAKRVVEAVRKKEAAFAYVFDEDDAWLPELGGYETSAEKRSRHRRAFLHVLYQHAGVESLTICLDPSNTDAVRDFAADGVKLRLLDIGVEIDDAWIEGHAARIGLGSQAEAGALHGQLLAALRNNIDDEAAALRHMGLAGYRSIREGQSPGQMARPIAEALGLSVGRWGRDCADPSSL